VTSAHPQLASSSCGEPQRGRQAGLGHTVSEVQLPLDSRHGLIVPALAFALLLVFGLNAALAQDEHKRKIPVVDKLTSGANRQAFSGKVETLDLGLHVLEVNASEGKGTEIFPVKNTVQVTTADGKLLKLKELTHGTNVIVYFQQKGDQRSVKEIVVLATAPEEKKPKSPPPS
jgi:hypothetical protein